jgi:hypothetical protein
MRRKRKRSTRVEVPFSDDEDAKLQLLVAELELSKPEVFKLGLTPEGRQLLEQAETRITLLYPHLRNKALALTSPENRARQQRSDLHLRTKANPEQKEQEAKEAQAKTLFRQGKNLHEVDQATGLGQARLFELAQERRFEDEQATRAALRERDKAIDQAGNYGPQDELARRIGRLRRNLDPEGTDEPPGRLHTLTGHMTEWP